MRVQLVRGLVTVMVVAQAVLACARFGESPAVDAGGASEASVVEALEDAALLPADDNGSDAGGMRVKLLRLVAVNANFSVTPLDAAAFYDGVNTSLPSSLFADGGVTLEAVVKDLPARGSVAITDITDKGSSRHVENNSPYTLSPLGRDQANRWQPSISTHVIVATPFSDAEGSGDAGAALRATITITP